MKIYYHLSIAEYELIKSSRGNGPMKLRQPLNLFKRCQFLWAWPTRWECGNSLL